MSPLDALAPDQRAVIQLVLQQGRSYEELAGLLGISGDAVRSRALAGLDRLAPAGDVSDAQRAAVADYLLGQQSVSGRERTRQLLAESASARVWAQALLDALDPIAAGGLPDLPPAGAPAATPARPTAPTAGEAVQRRTSVPDRFDEPARGRADEDRTAAVEAAEEAEKQAGARDTAAREAARAARAAEDEQGAARQARAAEDERAAAREAAARAAERAAARSTVPAAGADAPEEAPARAGRAASFLDDAFDDDDLFATDPRRSDIPPLPPDEFAEPAEPPAHKRRASAAVGKASSRLGGIALIVAVAAILAAVLIWALTRDDDDSPSTPTPTATAEGTQSPTGTTAAEPIGQINLRGAGGSKAVGIAQVFKDGTGTFFQLAAQDLPANKQGEAYAIWLYSSADKAVRLGFTPTVGDEGELVVQNVLPPEASDYSSIVLSLETDEQSTSPAKIILRGAMSKKIRDAVRN